MFIQADVKCKELPACLCKHWSGNKRRDVLCQTASGLEKWFTPFIDFLPNEDRWEKRKVPKLVSTCKGKYVALRGRKCPQGVTVPWLGRIKQAKPEQIGLDSYVWNSDNTPKYRPLYTVRYG